jgi:hypothetical protein
MGQYIGTKRFDEPGDLEVIHFEPSFHTNHVTGQSLIIYPEDKEKRETSIILNKTWDNLETANVHLILTEAETEMLIGALLETKRRWKDK